MSYLSGLLCVKTKKNISIYNQNVKLAVFYDEITQKKVAINLLFARHELTQIHFTLLDLFILLFRHWVYDVFLECVYF